MDARSLSRRGTQTCQALVRGEADLPDVLALVEEGIGADLATLATFEADEGPAGVLARGRPPVSGHEELEWQRLLPAHPYYQHILGQPSHAPRLTDVVDIRVFTGSEVYTDLLHPWGARYQAVVLLERSSRALKVLSLWRTHRDFTDAEVDALLPLGQALAAATTYRSALDRLGQLPGDGSSRPPTPRQRQVVELVARGLTNAQVGTRLGLSPRTVRKHLESLFAITGARSRTELAVMWREGAIPRGAPLTGPDP